MIFSLKLIKSYLTSILNLTFSYKASGFAIICFLHITNDQWLSVMCLIVGEALRMLRRGETWPLTLWLKDLKRKAWSGGRFLWVWEELGLHSKLQLNQGYIVGPYLKKHPLPRTNCCHQTTAFPQTKKTKLQTKPKRLTK